jgi:hypothetical protein
VRRSLGIGEPRALLKPGAVRWRVLVDAQEPPQRLLVWARLPTAEAPTGAGANPGCIPNSKAGLARDQCGIARGRNETFA